MRLTDMVVENNPTIQYQSNCKGEENWKIGRLERILIVKKKAYDSIEGWPASHVIPVTGDVVPITARPFITVDVNM